ncbi:MAG: hypothetical protein KJ065_20290 [Anaerolineae bacterium]|nr:hypothetical protein [Anaerolineae bacterium]
MNLEQPRRILWSLINAGADTTDIERRYQVRALNVLFLMFLPIMPLYMLVLVIRAQTLPQAYNDQSNMTTTIITALLLLVGYLLNRSGLFSITRWLILIAMTAAIVFSANGAARPEVEIVYLLAIPTIGLFLLSRGQMIMLSVAVVVVMIAFVDSQNSIPLDSKAKLVLVISILCILLLYVSLYRDTLEKSRSRTLIETETQLRLLLDNLPAMVWRLDKDLQPISSTRGAHDQMSAMLIADKTYRTALETVLTGGSVNFEHTHEGIPYRSYAEPLRDANGQIIGCVGLTIDVSAQRQEEARRRAIDAEHERMLVLADFLGSASHDLRTPLAEMSLSIELMQRAPDDERRRYHGERLAHGIHRLDHILDMMFDMARLDLYTPEPGAVLNLNEMVQQMVSSERAEAEDRQLMLVAELAPALERVAGSEETLRMAVAQVLRNALQNTPAGGSIVVRTSSNATHASVEIIDTGVGIRPDELDHVFDRFYRVEKHRPLDDMCVGLGLAIARRVIEMHSGEIAIESELGQGTRVTMQLPLAPVATAVTA